MFKVSVPPREVGEPEMFTSVPVLPKVVVKDEFANCALVIPALVAKFAVVSPFRLAVAGTPLSALTKLPVDVAKVRVFELMILVTADWIPFTKVLNELVVVERVLLWMIVLVASTPLVVLVRTFPVDDRVLVVLLAMAFASEVVASTPLTVEERT